MAKKNHKKQQKQQKKKEVSFQCPRCGECCIYTSACFDEQEMELVKRTITTIHVKFIKHVFERNFINGQAQVSYAYLTPNGLMKLQELERIERELSSKGAFTLEKLEEEYRKLPLPPCEFLEKTISGTRCKIYRIRPLVCREYKCERCHEVKITWRMSHNRDSFSKK